MMNGLELNLMAGESKFIEYKEKYSKAMLKTVSAFCNYHDGIILIGVSDDGVVIGVDDHEAVRLSIESAIYDNIRPRPYYEVEPVSVEDKVILVFKIFKGEHTPYLFDRKAYGRNDTSSVEVEKIAYDELVLLGRNLSFEELQYSSDSLSFNKLGSWLSDRLKITHVDENILKSLDLLKDGSYNNAAALIADRNAFPSNGLDLIRYGDRKMTHIIDRVSCDGVSVIEQFERAMAFYEKHINQGEMIDEAVRRKREEVPFVAYRETVANAIVHRDYMRSGRNRIEIFNDRIEVMSIGGLPVGISEEEYLRGSFSNMRNRIIADVFYRCGYIERLGTGIRRIREAYMDFEEKPIFQIYQNSIITTLPKQSQILLRESSQIPYGFLTADEDRAYNFILVTEGANRAQLEIHMDIKKTKAGEILKSLVDKGVVMTKGSGRTMTYMAKK